jgi:SpoVK/Ycf46/Vps4 family AAA+-type ATPase
VSTAGEMVRKLILAHANGDAAAFEAAAEEYIAEERRKNHHVLAKDLERVLYKTNGTRSNGVSHSTFLSGSLNLLGVPETDLPRDKDRDALLVEIIEPRRELDDLVLAPVVREALDRIVVEQCKSDLLQSYGLRPAGKVLFCGPPGCGKTVAAEAIAAALYLPLVLVRFDAVISSYLGETAANLRKVFTFARSRKMVMLFDEFDAIGKHRTAIEEHGELKRVVNSFLQLLDGFRGESLLIAATNHQGLLDSALWRRFDEIVAFDVPDEAAIVEVLRRNLHQIGIAPGLVLDERVPDVLGCSHADIERIAQDAVKQTVLRGQSRIQPDTLEQAIQRQLARRALSSSGHGDLPVDQL